jgi:hypothetical protein
MKSSLSELVSTWRSTVLIGVLFSKDSLVFPEQNVIETLESHEMLAQS